MRARNVLVLLLIVLAITPRSALAQSRKDLERERERLREEIRQVTLEIEPLAEPWLREGDLFADLSAAPLLGLIDDFNNLTPAERMTQANVTDHSGQLAGEDRGCTVGPCPACLKGRQGWFVEFADRSYRARLKGVISRFRARWVPERGPLVAFRLDLEAEVGTLHGHWDPECLTGGIGVDAGPARCSGRSDLDAALTLTALKGTELRYSLRAQTSAVGLSCVVSAGSLGKIPFKVDEALPRREVSYDGKLDLPLDLDGEVTLPEPAPPLTYRLTLEQPIVRPTASGLRLETDTTIEWMPASSGPEAGAALGEGVDDPD